MTGKERGEEIVRSVRPEGGSAKYKLDKCERDAPKAGRPGVMRHGSSNRKLRDGHECAE